jgi:hypothetical protein
MINPTGNIILVNQQAPIVSNKVADTQNRFDLQSYAAAENAKQQDKRVREARAIEKNDKMSPEHEHDKETAREEQGYTEEIEEMLPNKETKQHALPDNEEDFEYLEDDDFSILDVKV